MKPVSEQKTAPHTKNNLIIHLQVHPVPPVLIQTRLTDGKFAYPHLTAMDFPIRLQPFMS
ncbi:hypothetical protein DMH88_00640 [Escherichia coli]|nr:hypothetical protein [Escherichia coli]